MRLQLVNDAKLCNGHLKCCAVAPNLLTSAEHEDDEWTVAIKGQSIDVPSELVEEAEAAVALCPEEAYTLVQIDG
jgi:ferredoxin